MLCVFYKVCRNAINQECNIYGADRNCRPEIGCGQCVIGYEGDYCGSCADGYYVLLGYDGIVNSTSGRGPQCSGKKWIYVFLKYLLSITFFLK